MIQLEVAVAAPVTGVFSYELPDKMLAQLNGKKSRIIGRRILVPFHGRKITGYVLEVSEGGPPEFVIKEVIEILDNTPLFHQNSIALFKWVANYYHYPLGEVIKTALPAGLTTQSRRRLCLAENISSSGFAECLPGPEKFGWLEKIKAKGSLSQTESRKVLNSRKDRKIANKLVKSGFLCIDTSYSRDKVSKKLELCYKLKGELAGIISSAGYGRDNIDELRAVSGDICGRILGKAEAKTVLQIAFLVGKRDRSEVPRKELLAVYPNATSVIQKLVAERIVAVIERRIYRTPFGDLLPHFNRPEALTGEQQDVLKEIGKSLEKREYKTFLLHGITGSGKTEVYLEAAEQTLADGRSVLVLVPEIALAVQIEAHFVSRFGDKVALLHSGLSSGEKYDEWSRVFSGEAGIVIGARSAVFAPLQNPGLIIVDEEHDSSFKQEDRLRYNSRDIAVLRARQQKAVAILGSATPAITSFYHGHKGKFQLLEMRKRVGGRELPTVSVIDLKKKDNKKNGGLFHQKFKEALSENFERGKQSILLLNRRGFSSSVICRDCGSMIGCRHCNVTLNMHKGRQRLVCHYCGYNVPENVLCDSCGSGNLSPVGFGTERVEEEVRSLLPDASVARLDSDISANRKAFLSILQAVRNNEVDVLVGTQMIAKGLHFPNVTLVGIVWADGGLAFPDYRAAEKTYQLIAQVTGRAGRGDSPGHVIIQTMQPEHYAIRLAAEHRYEELATREIEIRKQAGFPPYQRLVSVRMEEGSEEAVRSRAMEVGSEARSWCSKTGNTRAITILGPSPAPIEKLRDMFRWQILLKAANIGILHELVEYLANTFKGRGSRQLIIDVDPENML